MKNFRKILVFTLLFSLVAGSAFAHKIRVFAYAEGGTIVGESAFAGGKAARNIAIEVYNDSDGTMLTKTVTDDKGEFSFPIPEIASIERIPLRLVANAGDGHKNSWLLNPEEYLPPVAETPAEPASQPSPEPAAVSPAAAGVPAGPGVEISQQSISEETLRRIVDESVEKQLRPVKHMLAETKERQISLQDIMGGLGYIFGLAGVAAYFSSRRKTEKGEK